MAAVVVVFLLRPPRARPLEARVAVGDAVATSDGLAGIVVRLDGAFALVDAGDERLAWSRSADLMHGDGTQALPGECAGRAQLEPPSPAHTPDANGLLARFAEGIWKARTTVVWGWLVAVAVCVPLAASAGQSFVNGGFLIKHGQAIEVLADVQNEFAMPVGQQTMIVPGPLAGAARRIDGMRSELLELPHVYGVGAVRPSKDGKLAAVDITFDAPDDTAVDSFTPVVNRFVRAGFRRDDVRVAGGTAQNVDINEQTKRDLQKAEVIGVPLALAVLLLVFGTFVSAVVPLLVGLASVVVTLALLHLVSMPLGLSIFVLNIASMLGFGLGIDYSLLGMSRFREELANGRTVQQAVITTVTTSGRAAAISGIAVLAGIAALAAIPLPVMFSIAVAGIVVVAVTVFASLTVLPALLAILGHRVERGRIRRRKEPRPIEADRWYRLAHAVMRKPGLAICAGLGFLALLATPVLTARLDVPHGEVLERTAPSVVARLTLERRFGETVKSPVVMILDTADDRKIEQLQRALIGVRHVQRVEVVKIDRERHRTLLDAYGDETVGPGGPASRELAARIAELRTPATLHISGQGAGEAEYLDVLRRSFPKTLLLILVSTLLILTVAFRSIALPIKAVVLDSCSLLASLGVVVAVFQHGIGIGLIGGSKLGFTEPTIPIILFCVLFGLSMDYEVFMLAKV
ncbi:MAG: putative rane protein, partial [Thermoleophilia bacterium]|nr:putative rane protein [Thermoleophilia bacterium]